MDLMVDKKKKKDVKEENLDEAKFEKGMTKDHKMGRRNIRDYGSKNAVPFPNANRTADHEMKRGEKKQKGEKKDDNWMVSQHRMKEDALDEKCWKGYEKKGMKTMFGKRYPNCVKKKVGESMVNWRDELSYEGKDDSKKIEEGKSPAWQRKEGKSESGGLNKKGVASYRAANPGSKLKTAVTTKPSKLKKGSKAANRRKSFCARMKGMKKRLTSAKTARDPDSRINKSLRKWNC